MKLTILLFIALVTGCARQTDTDQETARLLATDVEFSKKSLESGSAEAFRAFLADSAIQFPANSDPITGNENIYNLMKGGSAILTWVPKKAEVARSGELGYTWGYYTVKSSEGTGSGIRYGKYVNVWRKQADGLWKVIIDIGNPGPPPGDTRTHNP